jgi:hypothetical protein
LCAAALFGFTIRFGVIEPYYSAATNVTFTVSAELADRDYTCIHNITCKDDPVPYVAPTEWGFKRYGVDHSIYDENWDSENLQKSFFGNNLADNDCFKNVSDDRLAMVKAEIDKVTGSKASD